MTSGEDHDRRRIDSLLWTIQHADIGVELKGLFTEHLLDLVCKTRPDAVEIISAVLNCANDSVTREWGSKMVAYESTTIPADGVDLLILTVKATELRSTLAAFGITHDTLPDIGRGSPGVRVWTKSQGDVRIGIGVIGTDGNAEAASALLGISSILPFKAAVLVGMAAGLESEVSLGDVVISSWVAAYEFVRTTPGRFHSRRKFYPADYPSVNQVSTLLDAPAWGKRVSAAVREADGLGEVTGEHAALFQSWVPRLKTGVILSGSLLIEDDSLQDLKEEVHDRVVAAEMEGAGFAVACSAIRIPWLVVRGIADFGRGDASPRGGEVVESPIPALTETTELSDVLGARNKSWQFPSSYAAASFVRDMVVTGRIGLIPTSGASGRHY